MRLFLTGATGFVGFNLLLEALRGGRYGEITVAGRDPLKLLDQLSVEGFAEPPAGLRLTRWDEPPPAGIDHAVHCAGVLFARDRDAYFRVNVDESLRLLSPLPTKARLLVLSSQSAGGPTPPGKSMRTASDPDAPITWYGDSKLAMEHRLAAERPGTFIWRPPMIFGARDRATLPLFRMAASRLRIKPGLLPKTYSWIAVGDLVRAILRALDAPEWSPSSSLSVAAPEPVTDTQLIATAADLVGRRGCTLAVPHLAVRSAAALVDAIPGLRNAVPSFTRDRCREIFPDRWVIDGADFRARFASGGFASLRDTLAETHAWQVRAGLLRAA